MWVHVSSGGVTRIRQGSYREGGINIISIGRTITYENGTNSNNNRWWWR